MSLQMMQILSPAAFSINKDGCSNQNGYEQPSLFIAFESVCLLTQSNILLDFIFALTGEEINYAF